MLITSELKININNKTREFYGKLGYDVNNDQIVVKISDVPKGSQKIVQCRCDDCNKELSMTYQNYNKGLNKNGKTICKKCIRKYLINPFSMEIVKEKIKKTLMDKYGVDTPLKSKEIKEKRDNTMIERYGSAYTFDNVELDNKRKDKIRNRTMDDRKNISNKIKSHTNYDMSRYKFEKTMLERYGVENALQNIDIKEKMKNKIEKRTISDKTLILDKIKKSNIDKYGIDFPIKLDEFKNKSKITKRKNSVISFIEKYKNLKVIDVDYDNGIIKALCDEHGYYEIGISAFYHRYRNDHNMCIKCNSLGSYTKSENNLLQFIKENYNGKIDENKRDILNNKYEIDIYLPELKIGFEFNGLYWHSEIYKKKDYHQEKTNLAEEKNIKLIQIYEDDWNYKQDIVKSRILNIIGKTQNKIFARKCEIREINDNKLIRDFLENNHLQGFVGSKFKIGLFYDNELVSLMTFGNFRKSMGQKSCEGFYEMLRFCNKLNTNVIGGAGRLFKYFFDKYKPIEIISYADRSWSIGELYLKLGFKLIHKTKPNYYYIVDGIRKYRFGFRKNKLIEHGSEQNKTEHEIMLEKGIFRIYDSGSLKFIHD